VLDVGDRKLQEAHAEIPESRSIPCRQKAVRPLARSLVLNSLPGQRLCNLTCRLFRREDERDVTTEHALEDLPDQRIVRTAEDHGVDTGILQWHRVLTYGVGCRRRERIVALDQRHEARTCHREELDTGIECVNELRVAPRLDRCLRGQESDPAVPRRLHRRMRFGRDDTDDRNRELGLELRQCSRGRRVARVDDELDSLPLEICADLACETADLGERPWTVRKARMIAEIDEILVRKRDETLVEDGEAAHSRVEHSYRPRIHSTIVSPGYAVPPVLGRALLLCTLVACLIAAPATPGARSAREFTKLDTKVTMSDGVQIAVTYYVPAGTPPAGGWPAVMMFHGLGQTRNSFDLNTWSANRVAETYLVPNGYAVLTFDARAHGESGGLFSLDGPRELQDTRELFAWLVPHPAIDPKRVGAFGVSYGGGMVWLATVAGVPFKTIAVAATWTDLHQALAPQNLGRAGIIVGFSRDIPPDRYAPGFADIVQDALAGKNLAAIRAFESERSTRSRLHSLKLPVLMLQGRRDFAFDADQALEAFRLLRGPKRLYLGDLGHTPAPNPVAELPHYATETKAWFDRFLKSTQNGLGRRPQVEVAADPWNGKTVTYNGVPPTRALHFALGGSSTLTALGKVARTSSGIGHVETFGAPVIRIRASSRTGYAHLVAVLSAVRPDGSEILISDGGTTTPQLGPKPRTITIRPQDEITSIPRGSRLRVTIGARSTVQNPANLVYLNIVDQNSVATIGRVLLTVPVLKKPVSP